jgi:formylglycine-generating enzyme required for sulfatase activity
MAAAVAFAPVLVGQPAPGGGPEVDRVPVPAGSFTMGSEAGGEADERPRHTVSVRAFRIDRVEVSRERFQRCVTAGRCTAPRDLGPRFRGNTQPVVGVSWMQARAYCAWTGGRLPTEREWEKAARGTDGRTYPWGEEAPTAARAVFGRGRDGAPDGVGLRPAGASPYGALDLAGNVWEWTESPYDPFAYRHPDAPATCDTALAALAELRRAGTRGFTGSNPLPTTCERTLRGGAWNYGARGLRVTNRVHHPPSWQIVVAGFRCVDEADTSAAR